MKFQKGQSGNPSGKPKGSPDKRTALRALLAPHAKDLIQTCVDMAKAGDPTALRICMDRLVAPIREEPIKVPDMPKIEGAADCLTAQAAVLASVADGRMLPSEAQLMSNLIEAQRRAYETTDFARRLDAIEARLQLKGQPA